MREAAVSGPAASLDQDGLLARVDVIATRCYGRYGHYGSWLFTYIDCTFKYICTFIKHKLYIYVYYVFYAL